MILLGVVPSSNRRGGRAVRVAGEVHGHLLGGRQARSVALYVSVVCQSDQAPCEVRHMDVE